MKALYETVHGSHLYGLNHADSDYDTYAITDSLGKPKHSVRNGLDVTLMPFGRFVFQAKAGVPQALETMFSPHEYVGSPLEPFRRGYRAGFGDIVDRYSRTIINFTHGTLKQQRHGIRLSMNLKSIYLSGRFNPELSDKEVEIILKHTEIIDPTELHKYLSDISGIDLRRSND